jgi:uncharacterized RDD family membrane protein YckC
MATAVEFETPENIRVAYEPAGLGTRYLAWILDTIILTCLMIVIGVLAIFAGIATDATFQWIGNGLQDAGNNSPADQQARVMRFLQYFIGVFTLVWGLGSFVYFTLSELLLRGQTIGKRLIGLRVVRIDGFSLDAPSTLIRNIFRLVDQLPPVWIVPLMSKRAQRLGDMVAGTTVIVDRPEKLSEVRQLLADVPASEGRFTFDAMMLKRARPQDFEAIDKILERWTKLSEEQQAVLLEQIVPPLIARLNTTAPQPEERVIFLQELLAAEYRRQHRHL